MAEPTQQQLPAGLTVDTEKPGEVFVQAPDGTVGSIPAADLAQAQADGYRAASPDEVRAARNKALYESAGGQAATAVLGAGRGLFLGLPVADMAFEAGHGGAGAKQDIMGLQQANPNAYLAGEVAGSLLLPGPKGGGLGKAAAAAGAEGALAGAGGAVSDAYLRDQELTAEKLAAAAFQGGALGAGAAGGLGLGARGIAGMFRKGGGLLSRALARPGAEALQRAGDDVFGKAAPGLGRALDAADSLVSATSGAPKGALSSMFRRTRGGKLGFEVATTADDVLARAGDDAFERLSRVQNMRDAVGRRFKGDLKGDQVSRIISRGDDVIARQTDVSRQALARMRNDIAGMIEAEADFGGRGFLRKTAKRLDSIERKIDKAVAAGDAEAGAKSFMWLDGLKRDIGKRTVKMTRRAQRGGTADDLATAKWFENTYERMRGVLEDGRTWGQAADAQKAINREWARSIEGGRSFDKLFTTAERGRFGATKRVIDRDKVGSFIKSLKNPDLAPNADALNAHLDEILDFTETASKHMDLPAAEQARIAQLADEVSALRKSLGESREAITLQNQYRQLTSADGSEGMFGIGALGGLLGGAPGAALGSALGVLTRPGQTVKRVAAVHRVLSGVNGKAAKAIGDIGKGAVKRAGAALPRVARTAMSDYERRREEVRTAQRQPGKVRMAAQETLAPVAPAAQQAAAAAAELYLRRQAYLANLLPGKDTSRINARDKRPNPTQTYEFLQAARALDDPTSVLRAAANGTVTAAEVRAVEAVYPGMMAEMRRDVALELQRLDEQGKELPYGRRVALGVMLGAPVDPMLQPQMVALLQNTYTEAAAQLPTPPPKGKAPDIADAYRTGTEEDEDY